MNFILFQHDIDNNWARSDFSFEEVCYSNEEIISSLESVGFKTFKHTVQTERFSFVKIKTESYRFSFS